MFHCDSQLQKRWGDWAPSFGTEISGIVWVTNMSYEWLVVAFRNRPPIVVNQAIAESLVPKAGAQSL